MDIYDMMLEELEKGNALYVEVDSIEKFGKFRDKFRIVTPKSCEYISINWESAEMDDSCFLDNTKRVTPKRIIENMRRYDKDFRHYISTFTVL